MIPGEGQRRRPARLVVVISGRGRNLDAIMRAIDAGRLDARIVLVISDRVQAAGLQRARLAGLPVASVKPGAFADRAAFDAALAHRIAASRPDWVVLAGFMRILGAAFVERFTPRLVNIHPSLLPRYKGLDTHARALAAGDPRHGASIHFVTADLDAGPVIRQGSIAVWPDDTPDTLAARVLVRVEQRIYPAALAELVSGVVSLDNGCVIRNGRRQERCPHDDCDALV